MDIDVKLPFGLRNEKLVHISKITVEERGLKCNCYCPGCGNELIAKMGKKNIAYFSHSNSDCSNGVETALHLWTKELIKKANQITLPRLAIEYSESDTKEEDIQLLGTIDNVTPRTNWKYGYDKSLEICKSELKIFDEIEEEVNLGDIIPDLLVKINGEPVIIEIAVTHYVDDIKKAKIMNKNISAFEIDLSDCIKNINSLSKQELAKIILLEHNNKKWIYYRKTKQNIIKVLEQNREIRERKKREEVEREKKKQQEIEEAARANNKTAICKICNKETTKWTAYYGKEKSCKCRECYANEPW